MLIFGAFWGMFNQSHISNKMDSMLFKTNTSNCELLGRIFELYHNLHLLVNFMKSDLNNK